MKWSPQHKLKPREWNTKEKIDLNCRKFIPKPVRFVRPLFFDIPRKNHLHFQRLPLDGLGPTESRIYFLRTIAHAMVAHLSNSNWLSFCCIYLKRRKKPSKKMPISDQEFLMDPKNPLKKSYLWWQNTTLAKTWKNVKYLWQTKNSFPNDGKAHWTRTQFTIAGLGVRLGVNPMAEFN